MARMETHQGWRKKSTVTVLYSYSYQAKGGSDLVTMKEGERLILLEKSNEDWWQVRRPGDKSRPFYAPANYLQEDGQSRRKGPAPLARSDDSLRSPASKSGSKSDLLKQMRSTSMDSILIQDSPKSKGSSSLTDKLKKPRISKDLWERRKSWAVEDSPAKSSSSSSFQRFPPVKETSPAPPLPPRSDNAKTTTTTTGSDKEDKGPPALPPKRGQQAGQALAVSSPGNYSRVTPRHIPSPAGQETGSSKKLSESLEKLAQSLSYPHPIPPPRRIGGSSPMGGNNSSSLSSSPPQLPPKSSKGSTNYVNLSSSKTTATTEDPPEDIQSDESGINMSFSNPLFGEKEEKGSQEGLGSSSVDLESSIEDGASLRAVKSRRRDPSSSGEDVLSSKDSLNSIQSDKRASKEPPGSPSLQERPQRELFEGWAEYVHGETGRPFYYNRESRAKSWKPPRRKGPVREVSIEEEVTTVEDRSERTKSQMAVMEAVVEAARNRALPPVPPGWIQTIDPYTDEVFYTNALTGSRWYTSLDKEGRIYFYEEDSHESLWALPETAQVSTEAEAVRVGSGSGVDSPLPEHHHRQAQTTTTTTTTRTTTRIQEGVYYPEGTKLSPKMNPAAANIPSISVSKWDVVRVHKTSKAERNSKSRSMVLTNFSGCVEDVPVEGGGIVAAPAPVLSVSPSRTASLPRHTMAPGQWPTLQGGSIVSDYLTHLETRVLRQGVLQKTKLTENGKKIRKNWTSSWVVLTDLFLFMFKESAGSSAKGHPPPPSSSGATAPANKPELCVDLNGATIEWAAVKSSRKGVFQVSTLLGIQLLLQDEDETNAVVWFNDIKKAIQRLPCGSSKGYPSPVPSPKKAGHHHQRLLTPPSPTDGGGAPGLTKQGSRKGGKGLGRSRSTKPVPFLGSTEDLTAPSSAGNGGGGGTNPERQVKLRDKLRKFFVRRPTVETLVKKGIWKDEPVFGCRLSALCAADESTVPKFVQEVVRLIESSPENMKADGIYRASGNLSQIQKIRCQVDQYNWAVLEIEEDVHVLTGCLKLFFRELKEPLIPCELFERALQATSIGAGPERTRKYREIIESLPAENYDTLEYLLRHLLRITEYREANRMHISNLAIVFGPTLMWAATASNNLALDMMQQNLVVEALLNNYHQIFGSPSTSARS